MKNNQIGIGVGVSDFQKIKGRAFYIDKTLFIRDFINDFSEVILITRPRRFGKTLNLSMVENFLDITKDSTHIFKDTLIYQEQDIIEKHMNKYPVISINFKNYEAADFNKFFNRFKLENRELFMKYDFILNSEFIKEYMKEDFNNIKNETNNIAKQQFSLKLLTKLLYEYYNVKPIVLIDEYDKPFDDAFEKGYYTELKDFMSGYLSSALKDNVYLGKALMVGCKKVAQASLFSKFNNVRVYGIDNEKYNQYFGFTEDEVKKALQEANLLTFEEVKYWYDGYNVGGLTIYNPWSFLSYLDEKKFRSYWISTGGEYLLKSLLRKMPNFYYNLCNLIEGRSIIAGYNNEITYETDFNDSEVTKNFMITLLYVSGYLKIVNRLDDDENEYKIVNNEVKKVFSTMLARIYKEDVNDLSYLNNFVKAFLSFKFKDAQKLLEKIMPAYKTFYNEDFFYGLMYYVIHISKDIIFDAEVVTSNGRSDFLIRSKDYSDAFIIEVKKSKKESVDYLTKEAFEQIETGKYDDVVRTFKYIHKVAIVIHDGNAYLKLLDNKEYDYRNKYNGFEEFLYEKNK